MKIGKLVPLLFCLVVASYGHAEVKSVSSQSKQINEDGVVEKIVTVTCSGYSEPRLLRWVEASKTWCAVGLVDFCSSKKINVVNDVCSIKYRNHLNSKEKFRKSETARLRKELSEIQIRRLEIEQRRLDLRKKELRLVKWQKELDAQQR